MPKVLVIDDDRTVRRIIQKAFEEDGVTVLTSETAEDGLEILVSESPDVVFLDIMLPEMSGLEASEKIASHDSKLPIVFITSMGGSDVAIEAMKRGAYDYLIKPLDIEKVRRVGREALSTRRMMQAPVKMLNSAGADPNSDVLVGQSAAMLDVFKNVGRVATQDVPVLVVGESGTGKELVARAIYHHSRRSEGPFLAVNCAALSESLLDSELFGHEKGSFTGAESRRIGKFEQCDNGTIFLDEVGDMAPLVQGKVLRLLQQQTFERLGGADTIKVDVRIIAATNRKLDDMVHAKTFREDLFYRLNGFTIELPPLRERTDDIPLLIEHFLAKYRHQMDKEVQGLSSEALELLVNYDWPGNIRELQSVLRKALIQSAGPVIVPEFMPEVLRSGKSKRPPTAANDPADETLPPGDLAAMLNAELRSSSEDLYARSLEFMERYLLTRILRLTEGNQSEASRRLGITRGSLRTKIRTHGISIENVIHSGEEADDRP